MFQRFKILIPHCTKNTWKAGGGGAGGVTAAAAAAAAAAAITYCYAQNNNSTQLTTTTTALDANDTTTTTTTLLNWSGTHAVTTSNYWEPDTIEQVEAIVQKCHQHRQTIRPTGSALSPNAIAFCPDGMLQMAGLDQIVHIHTDNHHHHHQVTVQAGARVSQVIEALRPYNLTLPNLASIAEQQMGGLIQVGAHGTGRTLPPLDAYVTQLKLVTPAHPHAVTVTRDDPLFHWCTVGLGCLGVVVEITMQCVPAHELVEHTFVVSRAEAVEHAAEWLQEHRHMRYMWIPYTDAVVVVTNNPKDKFEKIPEPTVFRREEQFQPLIELLQELDPEMDATGMGFGELRDALLAFDPLNLEHVQRCNRAEAEFWKRSQGYRIKPSDEVLQFDCGGQQWVWEVCFPTGTQEATNGNDMAFMQQLLHGIETIHQIPAHAPIEQRWSASSPSKMSPAHGDAQGLHSWVGIIAYLPSEDERQRRQITDMFTGQYCDWMRQVGQPFQATSHWAKLERPSSIDRLIDLQLFLHKRFPVQEFNALRAKHDPHNILANPLMNMVLGDPRNSD